MTSRIASNSTTRHLQSKALWQKSKTIIRSITTILTRRITRPAPPRAPRRMPTLPDEIIEHIVSYLPQRTSIVRLPDSIKATRLAHPKLAAMVDRQFPCVTQLIAKNLLNKCCKSDAETIDEDLARAIRRTTRLKAKSPYLDPDRYRAFWIAKAEILSKAFDCALHVDEIDFSYCHMTPESLRPLVGKPYAELRHAYLNGNNLYATGFHRLIWHRPEALVTLCLGSTKLGDRGAALPLARMPNLKTLELRENNIGPTGIKALPLQDVPLLQHLVLSNNPIGDNGARDLNLFRSVHLRRLDLEMTGLTGQGIRNLGLGCLLNLSSLHLYNNALGAEGMQALKEANLPNLIDLDLVRTGLDATALKHISWPNIGSLRWLCLAHNELSGLDLHHLPTASLTNLRWLEVSGNPLGSDGFGFISPNSLLLMKTLVAFSCNLGAMGTETLPIERLPDLTFVNLRNNQVPFDSHNTLMRRAGRTNLKLYDSITSVILGEAIDEI